MDAKLGHPWTAETDLRWTVNGTPPFPPPEAWCCWIRTLLHGPAWILMHLVNVLSFLPVFPLSLPPSNHLSPLSCDLHLSCLNISLSLSPLLFRTISTSTVSTSPPSFFSPAPPSFFPPSPPLLSHYRPPPHSLHLHLSCLTTSPPLFSSSPSKAVYTDSGSVEGFCLLRGTFFLATIADNDA